MTLKTSYKSGIVVLVGRSNVGKSTLMNALVGEKVAAVSPLPQTTRSPAQGVVTRAEGKMVLVDTPGLMKGSRDALTPKINESIRKSLDGVNLVLYVADPTRMIAEEERALLAMVRNLEALLRACLAHMPEGEMLYPEGEKSSMSREAWVQEIIREKLYYYLHKEVPYTATVRVEEAVARESGMLYIRATVLTTDARYRKMIIGAGAQRIKEIGTAARKELSTILNCLVYLDLTVAVDPHWQEQFLEFCSLEGH